jgi:hypothetical protein
MPMSGVTMRLVAWGGFGRGRKLATVIAIDIAFV